MVQKMMLAIDEVTLESESLPVVVLLVMPEILRVLQIIQNKTESGTTKF
jgi:hypothetical protein